MQTLVVNSFILIFFCCISIHTFKIYCVTPFTALNIILVNVDSHSIVPVFASDKTVIESGLANFNCVSKEIFQTSGFRKERKALEVKENVAAVRFWEFRELF